MDEKKIKCIGILTSGGDAPGMNGLIRAVTRSAVYHKLKVMGIHRGYHGLWRGDMIPLDARDVSDISQRGGTILYTARSATFTSPEGLEKAVSMCRVFGLDAIFAIGGDGTWRGAKTLADQGIPVIALPATIDNDIGASDYTIGYDTAMNTALECIDKLRDTAASHERCTVVEVMGRHNGYLALTIGIATGAEIILIPEYPVDFDEQVIARILSARNRGKSHYIVIVAEGAGSADEVAERIQKQTGIESRGSNLGYVQRGGNPTLRDRYTASLMGLQGVQALLAGRVNRAVVEKAGKVIDIDLEEALSTVKKIPQDALENAGILSF